MAGGRKSWLSDGSVIDGKEVRANRAKAPNKRELAEVSGSERGCAAPACLDFLARYRAHRVPIKPVEYPKGTHIREV